MTVLDQLAENVLGTRFERFDDETVALAKHRIIDTIGCLIGGTRAPGCAMVLDLVKGWGGPGESAVLANGLRAPAQNAALVNGIMARSYDFEPAGGGIINGKRYTGHFSATSVPAALAVAEREGAGGRDLISSVILGDDLAIRVGCASNYTSALGWDDAGMCNRLAAVAIAARTAGLNERQFIHALGIVLNLMSGTLQAIYDGTHCFKLQQGFAAWAGIFSADLAAKGFTGPDDPLSSRFGFFNQYGNSPSTETLTYRLGNTFYADCEFKVYPCCRANHGAIEGVLEIVGKHDIHPDDVGDITLIVPPERSTSIPAQPFVTGEVPQANAAFNLRFNAANALMRREVKLEHFTDEMIMDPAIIALSGRVNISCTMPRTQSSDPLAVQVVITTTGGKEYTAFREVLKGDVAASRLTQQEVEDKFMDNVEFSRAVPPGQAEKALKYLNALEDVEDLKQIISLLE